MPGNNTHICPVEIAGILDSQIRRWVQNPQKILKPYINEGMTVLDIGCGPGFFSIEMARMVGKSGRVIASDLQEGMLQKVRDKITGTDLEHLITLHQCQENRIGITDPVDFILLFYMVHEVSHQKEFFSEIATILKPGGQILIVEPPLHVSQSTFNKTIETARDIGFTATRGPRVLFSKTAILRK